MKTYNQFLSESKRVKSLPSSMVRDYKKRASSEIKGGGSIDINSRIPTISITMSNGEKYFFQEHEAQKLLDEVPDNIDPEDFILAQAQNW